MEKEQSIPRSPSIVVDQSHGLQPDGSERQHDQSDQTDTENDRGINTESDSKGDRPTSPAGSPTLSENAFNDEEDKEVFSIPKRYILAVMIFCGFMNMYAIRVNLNVAIGAMIKNHTVVKDGKTYVMVSLFSMSVFIKVIWLIKLKAKDQLFYTARTFAIL